LALAIMAVSLAAISAYAAVTVTIHVAQPKRLVPVSQVPNVGEPQAPNRISKSNRAALLRDSPSYANFDAGLLAIDFSRVAGELNGAAEEPGSTNGLLSNAQIAGIESRLQLTPEQREHWPAVAVALRNIGLRYFSTPPQHRNRPPRLQMNSPEVLQLVEAAKPLILQLTSDQKREVRQLVRIIGLETVASQI
jgi:hypothetical protein